MSMQAEEAGAKQTADVDEITYRTAVNTALLDEMASDATVYLLGEDVAATGGVFKTNEGLVETFPGRVINTPICENGFVGVALGMAVTGLRPVVEIMFSDFLPTAADAIVNEVSKFRYMSGGQCEVPLTIRSIGGGTGRFGTQHSATGESWFLQLPGLYVGTAGSPGAAYEMLRAAIRNRNPVLFFEHKGLYGRKGPVRRGTIAKFGKAEVVREGSDVTILATLLMVERSLAAARELSEEGLCVEVIDLRWLRPLDLNAVRASLKKTGRLLVVEEQVHAAGWGATVISQLMMEGRELARPPQALSLSDELLIPYSPPLEDESIPGAGAIAASVRALMA